MACKMQRSCTHRTRTSQARVVRAEAVSDNAARVKGPVGKVFHYVSHELVDRAAMLYEALPCPHTDVSQ